MRSKLNEYQKLMEQQFNLEDKIKGLGHEQWKLKNKVIELGLKKGENQRQLSLVKDQVRVFFGRKILKFEEKENDDRKNTV